MATTYNIKGVEPVAHLFPRNGRDFAELLHAAAKYTPEDAEAAFELEEDESAASEVDDIARDLLSSDDEYIQFLEYTEGDTRHYRIGNEICVHWYAADLLCCGTAKEIAEADVQRFRQYLAECEEE